MLLPRREELQAANNLYVPCDHVELRSNFKLLHLFQGQQRRRGVVPASFTHHVVRVGYRVDFGSRWSLDVITTCNSRSLSIASRHERIARQVVA